MKNTYTLIDATEARDFMPTDCSIITERGDVVVGVVQEHGNVDDGGGEASRRARAKWGPGALLHGEGDDIEDGAQWLVYRVAQ